MSITATDEKVRRVLTAQYTTQGYLELMQEIFYGMKIVAPNQQRKEYSNFSTHIEFYSHIGDYVSPKKEKVSILAVCLKGERYVENSRSTQRSYAKKLIQNAGSDAAMIAFYTQDEPRWRISFVRLDYEMRIENGRIKTQENLTPAKRYSYLVGEGEPCHTAVERFRRFINEGIPSELPTLADLEEVFSVEKVTNEFFALYKEKFHQLCDTLSANEDFVIEAEQHSYTVAQFAKKLMGQIVFLYFLQKKGWLGVKAWPDRLSEAEYKRAYYARGAKSRELIPQVYLKTADGSYRVSGSALTALDNADEEILAFCVKGQPWGTGPKDFMRRLYRLAESKNVNFYESYLEPLFYEALNVNRGEHGYCPALHCRIPFLSGGLFEPIDGYDWKHNNFAIPNEVFSNADTKGPLQADGILDIFDRYNFTMSEDEPMEREVAIDPEMLGKVFENLLEIDDRKSKGAFYTPREIVHYMCQESLIAYLARTTGVSEGAIRDFILYGDFMKDEDTVKAKREGNGGMYISDELFLIDSNGQIVVDRLKDIDKALATIRVADPAVGSGAFPLGMLNEIVRARQNITAYMAIPMNSYDRRHMYRNLRSAYALKYETIKNCIFAADLEPSAVDIAQLRLWLSLVIDDEINPDAQNELEGHRNPSPLPNLECNIICGNSLVDEFEGFPLINQSKILGTTANNQQINLMAGIFDQYVPELIRAQDELFRCKSTEEKQALKQRISDIRDVLVRVQMDGASADVLARYEESRNAASKPYVLWQLEFARVFREKGGFDVVIGNPPYIGFHKVPNKDYNKTHYFTADGKYDLYVIFIERALQLTSQSGFVSYICPSYFYKRNYGKRTRELLYNNTSIRFIADFSDYQIFDSALTYTCIFGVSKEFNPNNRIRVLNKSLSNIDAHEILQSSLTEPTWILEKADTNAILDKVQRASKHQFGDITHSISQGIVTGSNEVYLIDNSVIESRKLERDFLHIAYKGKDVGNGALHDGGYMVFYPYRLDAKGKTVCIPETELSSKCPNLYEYLLEHKEALLERGYFAKSNKVWYELWNPRKMQHFYNRKFVFSEIGLVNDFVLVDECFYTDSVCGSELTAEFTMYEAFIHRYLNSRLATYVYKKVSVPKANGYSIYKNAFLKSMPVVLPSEMRDFASMSSDEFDTYLYTLVGLTADEIEMVETAQYSQA